ncbi:hypothetical protein [Campylobacter sp. RM12637]|uniref:hypothetical protein n=1 Tax=Campylobacter sp. RM12637 TaxID=2735734 RepID=UPI003015706B|nr:ornithine carbamoyltransferase [Campylobacter sp. RM12637]
MKIAIACKDILLEKTLILFLQDYLANKKDCDFLITDEKLMHAKKPQFIIGFNNAHLKLPFSKEQLIDALYEFSSTINQDNNKVLSFEEKLDKLLNKFKYDLLQLMYEK